MFTFLAFLLTIAGCVNWLMVGLLQYDFIAGLFGFQASIFSRLIYILFGIGAVYLVLRVIINKGTFKVFERKKKKEAESATQQNSQQQDQPVLKPAYANVEASTEEIPEAQTKPKKKKKWWQFWKKSDKKKTTKQQPVSQDYPQPAPENQTAFQNNEPSPSENPININIETNAEIPPSSQDSLFDEHFNK